MENLAQMTSGLQWSEGYDPTEGVLRMLLMEPDAAAYVGSFPQAQPAGAVYNYSTGSTTLLMYNIRRVHGSCPA